MKNYLTKKDVIDLLVIIDSIATDMEEGDICLTMCSKLDVKLCKMRDSCKTKEVRK